MSKEKYAYFANRPYVIDTESALFRYGENWEKGLEPCAQIQDKTLCIGRLDNADIKIARLMVEDYDRRVIKVVAQRTGRVFELNYAGKSTFVLLEPKACDRMFIKHEVKAIFNKESDRRDHVHVASVAQIEEAGWVAFYAPLQLERLFDHTRLVSKRTIETGKDPTWQDAERLKSAFTLIPNLHG